MAFIRFYVILSVNVDLVLFILSCPCNPFAVLSSANTLEYVLVGINNCARLSSAQPRIDNYPFAPTNI